MSITKQRSHAGKSVAIFFTVFIILELLIIAGVSIVFRNKDVTPSLMGYSMYVMDSDKMGDHVPQGSLVIAENGRPSLEGIKKAVLAENVPGIGTSVFWLANVTSSKDLTGLIYTVYHDKDPGRLYQLNSSNIIGVASTYYKTAGAFVRFATSNFGRIAMIIAPLFFLVLIEVIIMIVNRLRYTEEYDDEDDDEDEDNKNNVELDDFLFGGKNNKEMIENSVQSGAEVAEELKAGERGTRIKKEVAASNVPDVKFEKSDKNKHNDRSGKNSQPDPDEFFGKKEAKSDKHKAETKSETKAEAKPESKSADKPKNDYYEKASKLIDGEILNEEAAETAESVLEKEVEDITFTNDSKPKDISASLEDLMKLMEAESNKLKDQLGDKIDGGKQD